MGTQPLLRRQQITGALEHFILQVDMIQKKIVCPPLCCGWWFHGTSRIWRSHDHKLHLRSPNQALWLGQLYSSQLGVEAGMSCDLRRHIKVREMCLAPCAIMPTILHLRKSATAATSACAQGKQVRGPWLHVMVDTSWRTLFVAQMGAHKQRIRPLIMGRPCPLQIDYNRRKQAG